VRHFGLNKNDLSVRHFGLNKNNLSVRHFGLNKNNLSVRNFGAHMNKLKLWVFLDFKGYPAPSLSLADFAERLRLHC